MSMRAISLCLTIASLTPAQTFVVDVAGGPGSQFVDLPTAVATVPDGATLIVRSGTYVGVAIVQKSLTILADPGTYAFGGIFVRDLLATQQVVIRNVGVSGFSTSTLAAFDNEGVVVFDSCGTSANNPVWLNVQGSTDVRIRNCVLQYGTPLGVFTSSVRVSDCEIATTWPYSACTMVDSFAEFSDCTITAGGGSAGSSAILGQNSQVRLLGSTVLRSGAFPNGYSGTVLTGTINVRLTPGVVLDPISGPATTAGVTLTTIAMPSVAATTGPAGTTATATMTGPAGALAALYISFPAPLTFVPGVVDAIAILPGTAFLAAAGTLSPSIAAGYTVPPHPLLRGVTLTWQGATIDATQGLQISNAVTYVHF